MLSQAQLADEIVAASAGDSSIDDFEDWFRERSRNVHVWGSDELVRFVFAVEAVFSEYHFADLDDAGTRAALRRVLLDQGSLNAPPIFQVTFRPSTNLPSVGSRKAMGIASGVIQEAAFGEAHGLSMTTASQLVAVPQPLLA